MSSEDKTTEQASGEFPVAEVRPRKDVASFFVSKMWWLTLVCVAVAIVLAWQSMPTAGPVITISFPQGHGLKTGDAIRHRGIDVGIVQTANLTPDLGGIQVTVELKPEAEVLCREGSRFWVVRPRVALTGVEGLETVVGARYIAVSPGAADAEEQRTFEGLAASPPDEFAGEGLELILKADTRSGLSPGAPVTWRGVQVGQVLSVGLAPDSRSVNASVRIHGNYRRLVRSNSKFWVSSGIGVHIGLSGIDLNAESLASLALGGVSFTTPAADQPASSVNQGHVFTLHAAVDKEWLTDTAAIPLIDQELPETVIVEGNIDTTMLGIPRQVPFSLLGLLVRQGDAVSLLTANVPQQSTETGSQIPELQVRQPGEATAVSIPAAEIAEPTELNLIPLPSDTANSFDLRKYTLRSPTEPEACCVTRTVFSEGRSAPMVHSIGPDQLSVRDNRWIPTDDGGDDLSAWSGAPVMSLNDGSIIGVLTTTEQGTAMIPIPADLQN